MTTRWTAECVAAAERLEVSVRQRFQQEGESAEILNHELRQWEALPKTRTGFPPYFRAQVCYIVLNRITIKNRPAMDHTVPMEILAAWGRAIAREGLAANIELPDENRMKKALSRPPRFHVPEWSKKHTHITDGLSLTERIYAIHEQLEEAKI